MTMCTRCKSEVPVGFLWCPGCHANVRDAEMRLSSPSRRLAAHLMDLAIPCFALLTMFGIAGASKSTGIGFIMFVGYVAWAFSLFARGMTPGKRLMGIRVVKETGEAAGFGTMLIREWIGKFISALIFSLGFLWILIDKERQGWHDKLVSTYVVTRATAPAAARAAA